MTVELILLTIVAVSQIAGFTILGTMLYRMWGKMEADDAALYLQGRRMEEILREMRAELVRR